jgi:non-canonical (house-cleaning) NTP pyrophosphatase
MPAKVKRAALKRAAAARSAMSRGLGMTAGYRASSDNSLDMTVMRLREAARRNCEVCSHRVEVGTCTCTIRCTDRACQRDPHLDETDVSIP